MNAPHHRVGIFTRLLHRHAEKLRDARTHKRKLELAIRPHLEFVHHARRTTGDFVDEIELGLQGITSVPLLGEFLDHTKVCQHAALRHLPVHAGARPQSAAFLGEPPEFDNAAIHPDSRLLQAGQVFRMHGTPQRLVGGQRYIAQTRH